MQASWPVRAPAGPRPWLICLDLQRDYVIPGRPGYAEANTRVASVCARVLGRARREGWRIVHSQVRDPRAPLSPRLMFDAPIEGLRPLISEPVYLRRSLSAFADPAFAAEMEAARGEEVFLVGFSLVGTCLATALGAVDAGIDLTVIEDGVGGEISEEMGVATRAVLGHFVRLVPSSGIQAREVFA
jgi:nicotinamidase-related amidase